MSRYFIWYDLTRFEIEFSVCEVPFLTGSSTSLSPWRVGGTHMGSSARGTKEGP